LTEPAIRLEHVSKRFGTTQAVDDVSISIDAGTIHALVGENGAGKSTLGNLIGGVHRPDEGVMRIAGRTVSGWDTRTALGAGVAMIQQELSLVPDLTVGQNVFLGLESSRIGWLRNDLAGRYRELDGRVGFGLPPGRPVHTLRIADQQKVEILRALARDARVIIMDEPTSSQTADETEKLHAIMRRLQREGRTILYITHFLDAALDQSDAVSVMRDGRLVRTAPSTRQTKSSLIEAMLGRSLNLTFPALPPRPPHSVAPVLELRDLVSGKAVQGVNLAVRPGEIVGLAGLVGSGRSEIARAIYGAEPLDGGEIVVLGSSYSRPSPRRSIDRRVYLIPEDRRRQGLVMTQWVSRNISLPHLGRLARLGLVRPSAERDLAERMVDSLDVHPRRVTMDVATLSGGNQQKVLFGKWMAGEPRIVILDEPTRGVDIGAKRQIYDLVVRLAGSGAGILLISSELEEVLGLCNRVYLIRQGRIIEEVEPQATTVEDVLYRLFGLARVPDGGGERVL